MDDPTADLFRALEFAHYAERFREKVFVVALPLEIPFQDLLLDLKVLAGYRIQVMLVLPDPEFRMERVISDANHRGARFHLSLLTDVFTLSEVIAAPLDYGRLRAVLDQGKTPVIACQGHLPPRLALEPVYPLAGEVAARIKADKLFLVTSLTTTMAAASRRSHITEADMEPLRAALAQEKPADGAPLLDFIAGMLDRRVPDVILIEGRPSDLYREVFTLDGAGLLFNRRESSLVRQARLGDVTDLTLLLRPGVEAGRILAVNEADIETQIDTYWVHEIDGLPVGLARIKPYGEWGELAQFTTLTRYRGKGRARELAGRLEEEARQQGFRWVFALSIDSRMWEFFRGLGFSERDRKTLPREWLREYSLERPSRAFVKEL